jgi:acetyl-CoA synthetase (ADP-forming)
MENIIRGALENRQHALSEFDSKLVVSGAGVSVTREILAQTLEEALDAARTIGFPVVMKGCGHTLTHKTEQGMVVVGVGNESEAARAYDELTGKGVAIDGILVQEMVTGDRELVIGLTRDPQFGPCVMFGLGGIFTELLRDVSFRVAPLTEEDAREMIEEIRTKGVLDEFRGSPAVDREVLVRALVGVGDLGVRYSEIAEIDINPLIVSGSKPVAVDALVILKETA